MSGIVQPRVRPVADLTLTAVMLVIFGWALWTSFDWSFRAALFPRMVSVLGLGLAALQLITLLTRPAAAKVESTGSDEPLFESDDDADVQELEYEFAHASRRNWLTNIGWVAAFFGGAFVAGLFLTSIAFTVAYLRWGAGRSWRFAVIYAAVVAAVLWGVFDRMLAVAMPLGITQS
jgi:hypothetical protein